VTNQPDESHPLRDRVDDAISWFTQTDEPPEPAATPVAEERAPMANEDAPVVEEGTHAAEPVTGVVPDAEALDTPLDTPVAAKLPGNEAAPVDVSSHYGAGDPFAAAGQPEATEVPAVEPVAAEVAPAEPAATEVLPAVEPAAAEVPATEPALDAAEVAPERVYEADEFSAHPVVPAPSEPAPTTVATERVSEADDFMPSHAAAEPVVVDAEPVAPVLVETEPVADQVESSSVDEPTRIHPIEPPSSWAEVHPEAKGIPQDAVDSEAATTGSQRSLFRDEAPTVALPFGAAAVAGAAPAVEQTAVLDAQEAARVRREERAARDRQLGKVIAAPDDSDEPLVSKFASPSTYKALPSFGLLLFRLVIAAVIGIRAWQHITHLTATRDMWAATIVPSPGIIAWTQIGLEIAIAVMLVIGLGTRIAGLALLVLSIALLVFVQWGVVSPFQPGAADFIGVVDVLLTGAGILFATVGGGRVAFDGAIHTGRLRRKNDKLYS